MTIVCYREGKMASDSQVTDRHVTGVQYKKIAKTGNGWLIGFAGDLGACHQAIEMNSKKMKTHKNPNKDRQEDPIDGLAVSPNGEIWILCGSGWVPVMAEYYAIGTGAQVAMGALSFGASVETAVHTAIKHDVFCGGAVRVLEL